VPELNVQSTFIPSLLDNFHLRTDGIDLGYVNYDSAPAEGNVLQDFLIVLRRQPPHFLEKVLVETGPLINAFASRP
jgi:hypothetical protein